MSIEILLDVLLSAIVLYVYHSDCDPESSLALEFAGVSCSPEAYDFAVIPVVPIEPEWVLDEDDRYPGQFADEGSLTTCIPVSPTIRPTVKQLRTAAKLLGLKGASRLSKAELLVKVGGAMFDAALSELPIGDETLDLSEDGFSIT